MALEKQIDNINQFTNISVNSSYHKILNITICYSGAQLPDPLLDKTDDKIWVTVNLASYVNRNMRVESPGNYNHNDFYRYSFSKNTEITRDLLYEKIKQEPKYVDSIQI